jgi:2-iminobutanoate/2-iminopropanoate deaminase
MKNLATTMDMEQARSKNPATIMDTDQRPATAMDTDQNRVAMDTDQCRVAMDTDRCRVATDTDLRPVTDAPLGPQPMRQTVPQPMPQTVMRLSCRGDRACPRPLLVNDDQRVRAGAIFIARATDPAIGPFAPPPRRISDFDLPPCVCRKPRPFDLVTESLNVGKLVAVRRGLRHANGADHAAGAADTTTVWPKNSERRDANRRPRTSAALHAHIYLAGKTSIRPDGQIGGVGNLRGQIALVCEAVRDSLESVGANLNDVVRTVTYVLDIDAYYAVAEERYKYFASSLPTNTLIAVSRLTHPDMLVEIEAESIVDPGRLRNLKSYS